MNNSEQKPVHFAEIFHKAAVSGFSGMSAMVIQVSSLMWMRTIMNYQYRNGGTFKEVLNKLYVEGGILRFYRGYAVALLQGPLSRFGDTFSNKLTLEYLNSMESTKHLSIAVKTVSASAMAALFRILLTPVDTVKTILQVEGKQGLKILGQKIVTSGPQTLFYGAVATSTATFMGHYPWFYTFNKLNHVIPEYNTKCKNLIRRAFIGFVCSVVSDSISNSMRVIKTTKQTFQTRITYPEVVREILNKDGVAGLFGRGLKTRIATNGLQGLMFSVLWKAFEDYYSKTKSK